MTSLTIQFPTPDHKRVFAEWLCDGGGECSYMDCLESGGLESVALGYHGPENEAFPRNDKRRYGKFLEDDTIRVQIIKDEIP